MNRRQVLAGLSCSALVGCAGVASLPEPSGERVAFDAPGLSIRGRYHPPSGSRRPVRLWVVIEGDGAAWTGGRPPDDPTPRRPVGPSVVSGLPRDDARLWLGRPCQYLPEQTLARCERLHWTTGRFSAPVMAAYQGLINRYADRMQVMLIGYSGGGLIASELALTRVDAVGLVTLAAPLDLEAWTAFHGVPPLEGPRSPQRLLSGLAQLSIPALYLFGARDTVVPPAVLGRVRDALGDRVEVLATARHQSGWADILSRRVDKLI